MVNVPPSKGVAAQWLHVHRKETESVGSNKFEAMRLINAKVTPEGPSPAEKSKAERAAKAAADKAAKAKKPETTTVEKPASKGTARTTRETKKVPVAGRQPVAEEPVEATSKVAA